MIDLRTLLIIAHTVGTVLGVGGATVSDVLFFKSIRDGQITSVEFSFLQTVSNVVWAGLLILILSGLGFLGLYLLNIGGVQQQYDLDKIFAKLTIVVVIAANGWFIHHSILPLFAASLDKALVTTRFVQRTPLIFSSGAISAVSWYTAMVYGAWRGLPGTYLTMVGVYLFLLLMAVVGANIFGQLLLMKFERNRRRF